jgi:hypothetical protein
LTGEAPYKFESSSLQRRVHREPDFGAHPIDDRPALLGSTIRRLSSER